MKNKEILSVWQDKNEATSASRSRPKDSQRVFRIANGEPRRELLEKFGSVFHKGFRHGPFPYTR